MSTDNNNKEDNNEEMSLTDFYKQYEILGHLGEGTFAVVYKVLHKGSDTVMALKMVATDEDDLEDSLMEVDKIKGLKMFEPWTAGLPTLYHYSRVSKDILQDKTFDLVSNSRKTNIVFFLTMPLYDAPDTFWEISNGLNTSANLLDAIFELVYTIAVFNSMGTVHGDLHMNNVVFVTTDQQRQYTVNGLVYTVNNPVQPVIIDWANTLGGPGSKKYGPGDLQFILQELEEFYGINVPAELIAPMAAEQYKATLVNPAFELLTSRVPSDAVKTFQPLVLH